MVASPFQRCHVAITGPSALFLRSQIFPHFLVITIGETEMCAMTIFPLDIRRFPELFEVHFLHWRHSTRVELESLSDKNVKDVGLEPPKRDCDSVKPFWMP
jgi:uncharacterized protein YjiS (DUF1127 family)